MTEPSFLPRWVSSSTMMTTRGLARLAPEVRIFISLFLCLLGLAYAAFLGGIWIDTQMQPSIIAEGYRDMGVMELTAHTFRYLGWFTAVFAVVGGLFLATGHEERWKRFAAVWMPFWVVSDIAAAWLIRLEAFFAWQLFVSGLVLAVTFLALFVLIQRELWLKK
jgi:hypothetical protein